MSTSKYRMRAFRARRALVETAEQKENRLAVDRQYRRQRVAEFSTKKNNEERQTHLVSRSQYKVKPLADKRAKENAEERRKRLRAKRAKEMSRQQKMTSAQDECREKY